MGESGGTVGSLAERAVAAAESDDRTLYVTHEEYNELRSLMDAGDWVGQLLDAGARQPGFDDPKPEVRVVVRAQTGRSDPSSWVSPSDKERDTYVVRGPI